VAQKNKVVKQRNQLDHRKYMIDAGCVTFASAHIIGTTTLVLARDEIVRANDKTVGVVFVRA